MAHSLTVVIAAVLGFAFGGVRAGEALPDPTRPPPGFGGEPAGKEAAAAIEAEQSPKLTSVIIPAKGKPRAVIGGKILHVGDRVGELEILRIAETGVILGGPQGRETILLTPGIEKKMLRKVPSKGRSRVENQ